MTHPSPDGPTEPASVSPPSTADHATGSRGRTPTHRLREGSASRARSVRDRATGPEGVSTTDELLRVLISVTARLAVPGPRLRTLVAGRNARSGEKYIVAYNLCDGSRGVSEVARLSGLDHGNLSRGISRWVEQGVMFKLGPDARPVHLYRLLAAGGDEETTAVADEPIRPEENTMSSRAAVRPARRARNARNSSGATHATDGMTQENAGRLAGAGESLELRLNKGRNEDPRR